MSLFSRLRAGGKRTFAASFSWVLVGFLVTALFRYYSELADSYRLGTAKAEKRVENVKLAVVMPFTKYDVEGVKANLERWTDYPPCKQPGPQPRPTFYFYSNSELTQDINDDLDEAVAALPSSARKCFECT